MASMLVQIAGGSRIFQGTRKPTFCDFFTLPEQPLYLTLCAYTHNMSRPKAENRTEKGLGKISYQNNC